MCPVSCVKGSSLKSRKKHVLLKKTYEILKKLSSVFRSKLVEIL